MASFALIKSTHIYFFWDLFGAHAIVEIHGVDSSLTRTMISTSNSFWISVSTVGLG